MQLIEPFHVRRHRGFTLFEILVTILVVSFGLLGIAKLLASGLRSDESSYSRSQASWLANDVIDRMRANRTAAEAPAFAYNLGMGDTPAGVSVPAEDLIAWRAALAATLSQGTGAVNVDGTLKVSVTVQWNDSRAGVLGADGMTHEGEATKQLLVETRL